MLGSKLFQVLSGFITHLIPRDLGTCNILKYLSYVTKDKYVYVPEGGREGGGFGFQGFLAQAAEIELFLSYTLL